MTNTNPRRLACVYLLLASLIVCNSGNASEPTIGTTAIRIPEITGFTHLTSATMSLHPLGETLLEMCAQESCVVFVSGPLDNETAFMPMRELRTHFQIRIAFGDSDISADEFARMVDRMKQDTETIREFVGAGMAVSGLEAYSIDFVTERLDFIDSTINISDEVFGDDTYLAIAANGSNNFRGEGGRKYRDKFDMTFSFAHAGNKGLLITTFGPGKDAKWGRETIEAIIESLRLANR